MDVRYSLIVAISACVLTLVLWLIHVMKIKALNERLSLLENKLSELSDWTESHIKVLQNQDEEANARTIAVARNIATLQEQMVQLENQTRELKQQDPAVRMYHRAADMAKDGATVDEIVAACEMPFAEAQLLINLHQR